MLLHVALLNFAFSLVHGTACSDKEGQLRRGPHAVLIQYAFCVVEGAVCSENPSGTEDRM